MLGPLMSHELRYCYPLPTGCYEIDPKLFPPTPSYEVEPYRRSRPYGSSLPSQYNASCAGRKLKSTYEERKPLSDFTVAVAQGPAMAHWRQVVEIASANIFSMGVTEKGFSRDSRVAFTDPAMLWVGLLAGASTRRISRSEQK
jgi:hypothetical protein